MDALVTLLRAGYTGTAELSVTKARYQLMEYIVRSDRFSWVNDKVTGALFGYVQESWYSRGRVASDLFFYSTNGAGTALLRRFIRWGHSANATIAMNISSEIAPERAAKFYERMGLKRIGTMHREAHYEH